MLDQQTALARFAYLKQLRDAAQELADQINAGQEDFILQPADDADAMGLLQVNIIPIILQPESAQEDPQGDSGQESDGENHDQE